MNLQPVPENYWNKEIRARCCRCSRWIPMRELFADLDGPAFEAYWCKDCTPILQAETSAGINPYKE